MNTKPIILVIGATGAQGGSVAKALLQEGKYQVRALTRNPHSAPAKTLQATGAELVKGDLNDIQSLKVAMQGCYGVFGVTAYWEHFAKEYSQGKNLIDAVKASNIQHLVFSTQRDYAQLTNGILQVPHCDMKAALQEYALSQKIAATFVHVAFYYENFLSLFPLQQAENDGAYHFGFPQGDTPLAMVSVDDLGGVVCRIFDFPAEYIGRTVGIIGEDRSCADYAAILSKVLGQEVHYDYIPHGLYTQLGYGQEWANMFEIQRLCVPSHQLDLIESYGLNPELQTFEQWVRKNKASFEAQFAVKRTLVRLAA